MGNYSLEIAEPPASAGQGRDVASRGEGAWTPWGSGLSVSRSIPRAPATPIRISEKYHVSSEVEHKVVFSSQKKNELELFREPFRLASNLFQVNVYTPSRLMGHDRAEKSITWMGFIKSALWT